ncbi:MAG: hypothetical protein AB1730_07025 [Myxococcota bacterium]
MRSLALALGIAVPLPGSGTSSSHVVMVVALAFFVQVPLSSLASKRLATHAASSPTPGGPLVQHGAPA